MGQRFEECTAFNIDLHRSDAAFVADQPVLAHLTRTETPRFLVFWIGHRDAETGPKTQVCDHTKAARKGQKKRPPKWAFFALISGLFGSILAKIGKPEGWSRILIRKLALTGLVLGAFGTVAASASPLPRYGLFVFSSLCRDGMTDDLNGDRLVLVRLPFHDFGYMEGGDGGFTSNPLEDLKIEKGVISFRYVDQDEMDKSKAVKTVRSVITADSVGLNSWDGKPFRLARLRKVNGKIPICKK